ncbi:MAG: hypothetical protein RIR52_1753 [Acidobacteriota bacterium]
MVINSIGITDSVNHLPVAILAGGQSRRMGVDKGLIRFRGRRLIDYAIALAASIAPSVGVVLHRDQLSVPGYLELAERPEVRLVPDLYDHAGPLGGLVTAMRYYDRPPALTILPCDMPFLSRELISSLITIHLADRSDASIAVDDRGRAQPLVGVYAGSVLPMAESMIESGDRRISSLLERLRAVSTLSVASQSVLVNLNRPSDLEAAGDLRLPGTLG